MTASAVFNHAHNLGRALAVTSPLYSARNRVHAQETGGNTLTSCLHFFFEHGALYKLAGKVTHLLGKSSFRYQALTTTLYALGKTGYLDTIPVLQFIHPYFNTIAKVASFAIYISLLQSGMTLTAVIGLSFMSIRVIRDYTDLIPDHLIIQFHSVLSLIEIACALLFSSPIWKICTIVMNLDHISVETNRWLLGFGEKPLDVDSLEHRKGGPNNAEKFLENTSLPLVIDISHYRKRPLPTSAYHLKKSLSPDELLTKLDTLISGLKEKLGEDTYFKKALKSYLQREDLVDEKRARQTYILQKVWNNPGMDDQELIDQEINFITLNHSIDGYERYKSVKDLWLEQGSALLSMPQHTRAYKELFKKHNLTASISFNFIKQLPLTSDNTPDIQAIKDNMEKRREEFSSPKNPELKKIAILQGVWGNKDISDVQLIAAEAEIIALGGNEETFAQVQQWNTAIATFANIPTNMASTIKNKLERSKDNAITEMRAYLEKNSTTNIDEIRKRMNDRKDEYRDYLTDKLKNKLLLQLQSGSFKQGGTINMKVIQKQMSFILTEIETGLSSDKKIDQLSALSNLFQLAERSMFCGEGVEQAIAQLTEQMDYLPDKNDTVKNQIHHMLRTHRAKQANSKNRLITAEGIRSWRKIINRATFKTVDIGEPALQAKDIHESNSRMAYDNNKMHFAPESGIETHNLLIHFIFWLNNDVLYKQFNTAFFNTDGIISEIKDKIETYPIFKKKVNTWFEEYKSTSNNQERLNSLDEDNKIKLLLIDVGVFKIDDDPNCPTDIPDWAKSYTNSNPALKKMFGLIYPNKLGPQKYTLEQLIAKNIGSLFTV